MFYTTEIQTDFTIWVDDPIDLTVQVMPMTLQGLRVDWKSSNEDILKITKTDEYAVHVECLDNGSLPSTAKITLTCAAFEKELTVYCRPAKK
ncbi:MAG: hypothetical protein IKT07_11595 [Oscillospiraceae bacterium]|nr:hypothetical protein [Oscillospiraceae bacterium]